MLQNLLVKTHCRINHKIHIQPQTKAKSQRTVLDNLFSLSFGANIGVLAGRLVTIIGIELAKFLGGAKTQNLNKHSGTGKMAYKVVSCVGGLIGIMNCDKIRNVVEQKLEEFNDKLNGKN